MHTGIKVWIESVRPQQKMVCLKKRWIWHGRQVNKIKTSKGKTWRGNILLIVLSDNQTGSLICMEEWWQLSVEEEGPCPQFVLWMRQKFGDLNSSRTKQIVSAAGLEAAETTGHPVSVRNPFFDVLESETTVAGLWGNYYVGCDTELSKVD